LNQKVTFECSNVTDGCFARRSRPAGALLSFDFFLFPLFFLLSRQTSPPLPLFIYLIFPLFFLSSRQTSPPLPLFIYLIFPLFFLSSRPTSHPLPLFIYLIFFFSATCNFFSSLFFFFFFFSPQLFSSQLLFSSLFFFLNVNADPLLPALPTLAGDPNARPNPTGAPGTLICSAVHR
jgi:hypothetical protein